MSMIKIDSGPSFAYQVLDELWIGNAPSIVSMHEDNIGTPLAADFDTLVLCAAEYQLAAELFAMGEVIHAPMDDLFAPMTKQLAITALEAARHTISRLVSGKRVLVTCLAGRNRSGLVCALALCLGPPRLPSDKAITLIRAARGPHALANPFFVRFLKSLAK